MTRKTRANRKASTSSEPSFESDRFPSVKNQELYEKLNIKRKIWANRKVLLDKLDPAIKDNFERKGWLPLLDINHPPPAALIREFYSNLSIHVYDSNTLVKCWIRGDEYTIILSIVANAFGYCWSSTLSIPIYSLHPLMTLCHTSLGLPSSGVLILRSLLLSSLRFTIFSLG